VRLPPSTTDPAYNYVREHDIREMWQPSMEPHTAFAYRCRVNLLLGEIRRLVSLGGRILDVGCAQGTLGLLLAEEGYEVTLLDVRAAHIAYARDRYERGAVQYFVGHLSASLPSSSNYDAIVCTEVLEHVRAPALLLSEIYNKLRSEGLLFLTTPNSEYAFSRLPTFGGATQQVIDATEDASCDGDAHKFLYSREELSALLRGVGFAIDGVVPVFPFWTQGHAKTRILHRLHFALRGVLPNVTVPTLKPDPSFISLYSTLFARAVRR
jgi:2-polyprenyl-3-methyl-5-hydroxy-6-metoxy-1,4-benzoquinol methylase